ncbi:MAG TPA: Na+/H+ antiporter NhaA [Beijerinckiaceae bacterium]|jgi:NhaA family Na+:H+ antiporter|nr:Na+/H+ antiporter NhaA [Beijerinckiaceae bacterium]
MSELSSTNRLDRPVDEAVDHILGDATAEITLVEYGSYACPHCRAANDRIIQVREQFGDRLRYVFRHRPLTNNELARRAAELVEYTRDSEHFWDAHVKLMTRSTTLTEDDLRAVASDLGLSYFDDEDLEETAYRARQRVDTDISSSYASGVMYTPTFFINGRRYDGPWDESSFADAMLGSLGHRVRSAALDFASWAPSTGILLLLGTIAAVLAMNSALAGGFEKFWHTYMGLSLGDAAFRMSLLHWVNDALLTIFFLVVGLEIKREFTVGHLASRRSAALPIAGALGGMVAPALLYLLVIPSGPWAHGWGVPMATDTAFAVALIVMMGQRVPVELRIFLTAAAIVDDIGSIIVVAAFYSGALNLYALGAAVAVVAALAFLNRSAVYATTPYILLGIALWICVYVGGLHATLAGVVLALFIPTRPPPNLRALITQANSIVTAEAMRYGEALRHGPSAPAMRALDAIHDRLESPADRMLRHVAPRSSYFVLPLFALANAGVVLSMGVWSDHPRLMLAIILGLVVGKPIGMVGAAALAVWLKIAVKPAEYSWRQLWGAGALAGIGFTMSLFIAGQAFPVASDFDAAKIAVFCASILSAIIGVAVLWTAYDTSAETNTEADAPKAAEVT